MTHPYRSVLYIPASKERALEKARELAADAIIFDLEDAVAPEEKGRARAVLAAELNWADYGPRRRIVRVNGRTHCCCRLFERPGLLPSPGLRCTAASTLW